MKMQQDYYLIVECKSMANSSKIGDETVRMKVMDFSRDKDEIVNRLNSILGVMGKLGAIRWASQTGLPYVSIANPSAIQHYVGIIGRDQFKEAARNKYTIVIGIDCK